MLYQSKLENEWVSTKNTAIKCEQRGAAGTRYTNNSPKSRVTQPVDKLSSGGKPRRV